MIYNFFFNGKLYMVHTTKLNSNVTDF